MTVEVIPVTGLPEIRPGDDLAALLSAAVPDLRDRDVLCVTQKVVSKAEGRLVPESDGHDVWVARETRRVVARRGDMVIARTRHGFVCANAGVDASNVEAGLLSLLPEDPDASAAALRERLASERGVDVGVVITDTFGRPWRNGLVNVAIGCAGMPAVVDLRGSKDHSGRVLEATVVALADEVAAASGLVMAKDAMVPAAVVRGLTLEDPPGTARDLVRPAEEDLFRESTLESIRAARQAAVFSEAAVPRETIEEAVLAATGDGPSLVVVTLDSAAARRRLLAAIGLEDPVFHRAPVLIVPAAPAALSRLEAGAAVGDLTLALHALGLASRWAPVEDDRIAAAIELAEDLRPAGIVAVGRPAEAPDTDPAPRPG